MKKLWILLVLMLVGSFIAIGVGSTYITPSELLMALTDRDASSWFIVYHYRLPRGLLAILAGAGLAVAGVLLPLAYTLQRKLDIMGLDEESSAGLGLNVKRVRTGLLAVSVALAAACVAAIGSIGFIGLLAPHLARRLFGNRHRYLLPGAAMIGALILVLADALGRGLKPPLEIPAGIVTAVIGAPYFLYLLLRERKSRGSG